MIMKKIITVLAIISLSMTACADRHQTVAYSEIPVQAQAFIEKYFKSSDVAYIERELENLHFEYNVYMKNGAEIEFDHQGNLKSIDCRVSAIPEGIVPEVIAHYVALHYPNHSIVESRTHVWRSGFISYISMRTLSAPLSSLIVQHPLTKNPRSPKRSQASCDAMVSRNSLVLAFFMGKPLLSCTFQVSSTSSLLLSVPRFVRTPNFHVDKCTRDSVAQADPTCPMPVLDDSRFRTAVDATCRISAVAQSCRSVDVA